MEAPMPSGTLRSRTLEEIKNVKWDPAWGEERMSNMIATRPDWCISRQRVWGVPIAVFLCESCGKPLNSHAVNRRVVELFARFGADAWFTPEADAVLPPGTQCPHCGRTKFERETDIFDVWLESGASYLALIDDEPSYPWPSDLYLEGGDQYRGWFQSSLLCAMGTRGTPPYKGVVTPGWTLDEKGQAMSKSRGNDVDPVDISSRLGAEVVRLWVASVDFREDVVGSEGLMLRVAENYRKIRNTFRYILGNLGDFDPEKDAVPFEKMEALDQYMLCQTQAFASDVRAWYEEFAFHKIYHRLNHFCIVDLSAFYFDVLKDRLYISAPKSQGRRSAQTAIWRIGEALVRLLAPIMSFTAEEVWDYLPKIDGRGESVHLALFPGAEEILGDAKNTALSCNQKAADDWTTLRSVRDEVLKALEEARNNKLIGTGLEAQVAISAPDPVYSLLSRQADQLRYLFIVSAVKLTQAAGNGTGDPGYKFKNETSPDLTFDRPGRLAYANAGPDTNGSQFFITEVPYPSLNGGYTIFGQCDDAAVALVKQIARMASDPRSNRPFRPVTINHITIVKAGGEAAAPKAAPKKPATASKTPPGNIP